MFETQPTRPPSAQPKKVKKSGPFAFWISLLILLLAIVLGGLSGYQLGIFERVKAQTAQSEQILSEQLGLARQDLEAGRHDIARQRLEYILQKDPNYPDAANLLAKVLVKQAITPTLVPTATPTITPTVDMRSQETIYAQAQQQIQTEDWTGALNSLDSLRKADPAYHVVQVDGMYYTALRNRGVDQILGVGAYPDTNMEGGIYDLTLAERFGPLDNQAEGLRVGARMFLLASSFYGIDWAQAVQYFGEVNRFYPNLRDATDITASQRYREALLNYGDQQTGAKKLDDRCQALDSWSAANAISPLDGKYSAKYNALDTECNPPTPAIDPASLITPTVAVPPTAEIPPTAEPPTAEPPTPEPPTPEPTATP